MITETTRRSSTGTARETEHRTQANQTAPSASLGRRDQSLLVYGFIAAAVMSSQSVGDTKWLIYGDLILALTLIRVISLKKLAAWPGVLARKLGGPLGLLALALGVSSFINSADTSFDFTELAKSSAKFSFYILGFCAARHTLLTVGLVTVAHKIRRSLQVLLFVSIAQQVAAAVGISYGLLSTYATGPWDRSAFPRSASLFSEPAYLTIFVVVSLTYLHRSRLLTKYDLLTGIGLLALAASLSGVALAVLSLGSILLSEANWPQTFRAFLAVVLVLVVLQLPPLRGVFEDRVVNRIEQTLSGGRQDASGQARLLDGWLVAGATADNGGLIFGVGPGQLVGELERVERENLVPSLDSRALDSGGLWNIFANVLIEGGILAMIALAICVISNGWKWWPAIVIQVGIAFATGTFYGWMWWFCFLTLGLAAWHLPTHRSRPVAGT